MHFLPFSQDDLKDNVMRNARKDPYTIYGQLRPRSACASAQADHGLHCPLTESVDTVVSVDEKRMLRSDCTHAHANLDLHVRCSHIVQGPFSCVAHRMVIINLNCSIFIPITSHGVRVFKVIT